jgi:hypothetical protein
MSTFKTDNDIQDQHIRKIKGLFLLMSLDNTPEKVEKWLDTENANFGGSQPITLIKAGKGHKVVMFVEAIAGGY